jgi:hypothetical protein
MRLPPDFCRVRVHGLENNSGWIVRVGNKAAFIPCRSLRFPGGVRKRLAKVLGIDSRPPRSAEDRLVMKSRMAATHKRNFRNRLAKGEKIVMPWFMKRRVKDVAREERVLDIAQKFQRAGEYMK